MDEDDFESVVDAVNSLKSFPESYEATALAIVALVVSIRPRSDRDINMTTAAVGRLILARFNCTKMAYGDSNVLF